MVVGVDRHVELFGGGFEEGLGEDCVGFCAGWGVSG
jgi:hypothetical protein